MQKSSKISLDDIPKPRKPEEQLLGEKESKLLEIVRTEELAPVVVEGKSDQELLDEVTVKFLEKSLYYIKVGANKIFGTVNKVYEIYKGLSSFKTTLIWLVVALALICIILIWG